MSTTKLWIIVALVVIALIQAGLGGLRDLLEFRTITSQHGWHDAIILLLLAILIAIMMK
jgi:hypothetical protein